MALRWPKKTSEPPQAPVNKAGTSLFPQAVKTLQGKKPAKNPTVQTWIPLADLQQGCLMRPDGAVVGGLSIAPINLDLQSDTEKGHIIQAVQEALNGILVPWELVSIYRPVDLDAYLGHLDTLVKQSDSRRRALLQEYLGFVRNMVRSGSTVERRYYLLLTRQGSDAVAEHQTFLPQLSTDFNRARGMQTRVMDDAAWRELLFLTFQADHAAVEPIPDVLRLPTRYVAAVQNPNP